MGKVRIQRTITEVYKANPLDVRQYLLACIAEEANEIAQAAMKALRFGLDDTNPKTGKTNLTDIRTENIELQAVIGLLQGTYDTGQLPPIQVQKIKDEKIQRLLHWAGYSEEKGLLA